MGGKIDMVGLRYGRLTVLREAPPQNGRAMVWCRCDCGTEKAINRDNLRRGLVKSCGRCRINPHAGEHIGDHLDITGEHWGRLTAVKFIRRDLWLFRCDCGKLVEARPSLVKAGEIQSCGCLLRETAKRKAEDENVFEHYDGTAVSMLRASLNGTHRRRPGASGHVGVKIRKYPTGVTRYQAHITLRGRSISLGTFATLEEAVAARRAGEEQYYRPLVEEYDKLSEENENGNDRSPEAGE